MSRIRVTSGSLSSRRAFRLTVAYQNELARQYRHTKRVAVHKIFAEVRKEMRCQSAKEREKYVAAAHISRRAEVGARLDRVFSSIERKARREVVQKLVVENRFSR